MEFVLDCAIHVRTVSVVCPIEFWRREPGTFVILGTWVLALRDPPCRKASTRVFSPKHYCRVISPGCPSFSMYIYMLMTMYLGFDSKF